MLPPTHYLHAVGLPSSKSRSFARGGAWPTQWLPVLLAFNSPHDGNPTSLFDGVPPLDDWAATIVDRKEAAPFLNHLVEARLVLTPSVNSEGLATDREKEQRRSLAASPELEIDSPAINCADDTPNTFPFFSTFGLPDGDCSTLIPSTEQFNKAEVISPAVVCAWNTPVAINVLNGELGVSWTPPVGFGMDALISQMCPATCARYGVYAPGCAPSPPSPPAINCADDTPNTFPFFSTFGLPDGDCSTLIPSTEQFNKAEVISPAVVCAWNTPVAINVLNGELGVSWTPPVGFGMDALISQMCPATCARYGVYAPGCAPSPPSPPAIDTSTIPSVITCSGGAYPDKDGWSLSCSGGTTLSSSAPYASSGPLAVTFSTNCTLSTMDSFGDGWDGVEWVAPGLVPDMVSLPAVASSPSLVSLLAQVSLPSVVSLRTLVSLPAEVSLPAVVSLPPFVPPSPPSLPSPPSPPLQLGSRYAYSSSDLIAALEDSAVSRIVLVAGTYEFADDMCPDQDGLGSALCIDRNVTIEAEVAGSVVLDAKGARRVMYVSTAGRAELIGLDITGGYTAKRVSFRASIN